MKALPFTPVCNVLFAEVFPPIIGTSALDFPFPTKVKYNMTIVPNAETIRDYKSLSFPLD